MSFDVLRDASYVLSFSETLPVKSAQHGAWVP